jgi:hypothetical protein
MEEACKLSLKDVVNTVLARLIFLFADLIYIFIDDFNSTNKAIL